MNAAKSPHTSINARDTLLNHNTEDFSRTGPTRTRARTRIKPSRTTIRTETRVTRTRICNYSVRVLNAKDKDKH